MRVMSFAATVDAMLRREKTVTRRNGWSSLQPGTRLLAVAKARGIRVQDRQVLGEIEVVRVDRVPLGSITMADCAREGLPGLTPEEFVALYARMNGLCGDLVGEYVVTRIEFRHVDAAS